MLVVDCAAAPYFTAHGRHRTNVKNESEPLLGDSGSLLLRNYLIKKEQSKENVLCTNFFCTIIVPFDYDDSVMIC